ncbi:MAG: DUF429 domain-containing protein [Thermomicrobium sp.]
MEVAPHTRFLGIDFSAAQDAADRTWVTVASGNHDQLAVVESRPLRTLLEYPSQPVSLALVSLIVRSGPSVIGCDACFSLPLPLVDTIWEDWLCTYPRRFPNPDALRRAGRDTSGRERKRLTDRLVHAPFAPTNLRLFRQTDAWLREVLYPVVAQGVATVAPFHPRAADRPFLMEVCPAVSLRALALPHRGYKGRAASAQAAREQILRGLQDLGVTLSPALCRTVIAQPGGDALDSIVAAVTAWLVTMRNPASSNLPAEARREGWIYVPEPPFPLASRR